ncbi:methicillin resistance protein, partial [Vibrio anguillarum]|nr:methicillin resistance protein [Vibrio anguillarum]
PSLTQNLGPWIRSAHGKYSKQLSREKDLMEALIEQLPQHHYFNQNWHYSNTNWLPFYWKGFEQSTRYTYVISSLDDINSIWEETQDNIRREIRKAENRFGLVVNSDLPISDFFELNQLTFSRQGLSMPYSEHFVENIVNQAKKRKQC